MIMGLMLPVSTGSEFRFEMCSQKLHCVQLIRPAPETHPNKVKVIWHEAIGRAIERLTRRGVKHHLPEGGMEPQC
jgi:hypothetical protein